MTESARNFLLIMAVAIVSAVGVKFFWDDYQFNRAMEQSSIVVGMIDQIRSFPGSSRIESKYEGPSVNEYATSVHRYYRAAAKCSDVEAFLDSAAVSGGFGFHSVEHPNRGRVVFYRTEPYELRVQFPEQHGADCNYSVSVNWTGSAR